MKFEDNPYYSPELCGLEIFEDVNTADSYEYDIFCIWRKLDDNTLWYDTDAGCSCPSPFDNGDHGHDLKQITPDTLFGFEEALKNHRDISQQTIIEFTQKVKQHLKGMEPTNINEENTPLYSSGYEAKGSEKKPTISPRTLGMYLGCEIYDREYPDEGIWILEPGVFAEYIAQDGIGNVALLLRPLSSMAEGERGTLPELLIAAHKVFYLCSLGFDLGGFVIINGKEQWVASLIEAGVAKIKEA